MLSLALHLVSEKWFPVVEDIQAGVQATPCSVRSERLRPCLSTRTLIRLLAGHMTPLLVTHPQEFEAVLDGYRVVYREYVKRGICKPHYSGLYFNTYLLTPAATQFLLWQDNNVAGTLSLIEDSDYGLPLETLYGEEIEQLRAKGCRLAEVGALALHGFAYSHGCYSLASLHKLRAMFSLFCAMFHDCNTKNTVSDLVIVVHPRHRKIYEMLGFRAFGPIRSYDGANGKPALPLHASMAAIARFVRDYRLERFISQSCRTSSSYRMNRSELEQLNIILWEKTQDEMEFQRISGNAR